jgi:GR25 family glycosyltransferase involved in LPS biosynthesis
MEFLDKFYVINLDRKPERMENFMKEYINAELPHDKLQRFSAVDGNMLRIIDILKFSGEFLFHPNGKSMIGNHLSHHYILYDIVKNGYKNSIIVEDDVMFKNNIREDLGNILSNLPSEYEIIWIGILGTNLIPGSDYNYESFNVNGIYDENLYIDRSINEYVGVLKENYNPTTIGYLISQEGAKNYIEHIEKFGFIRETDHSYTHYLKNIGKNYISRKILCTSSNKFSSDINTN